MLAATPVTGGNPQDPVLEGMEFLSPRTEGCAFFQGTTGVLGRLFSDTRDWNPKQSGFKPKKKKREFIGLPNRNV